MSLSTTLYSAEQTRELDRIAIEDFAIPGYTLMQHAGQVTFDAILQKFPDSKSLCVVCGTGNNGGDGYVIARLALQKGLAVQLIQLGNEQAIAGDALLAKQDFEKAGGRITIFEDAVFEGAVSQADIIVDAIFGTGLTREVTGQWADAINAINTISSHSANSPHVVAVDIPSGLHSDTGRVMVCCVQADLTVTYIGIKCGLVTGQARDYVGELLFDSLQIPDDVYKVLSQSEPPNKTIIPDDFITTVLKPRARCSHKGSHGHALLIGGAPGMSGAIHLAGEACLRGGAGLVSIATHPIHAAFLNLNRPELMVSAVEQASALAPLLQKADVLGIGPGLSQSDWGSALLTEVLSLKKPLVADADALNLLAKKPCYHDNWILTPHPAEAARLLSISTTEVEQDRYKSVLAIQQQYGGVCILKGAGTLVTNGEKIAVCTAGNPGMASGGMGDILTGIIVSLLAQGLSLFDAAKGGVELHAQAADLAAKNGERGLLASDCFPFIRELVNA